MKKLKFNYEEKIHEISLNKINFMIGNNDLEIIDIIKNGFSGKCKKFEIDNQKISARDYEVFIIDEKTTMLDQLKLTSKSYITRLINDYYGNVEDEEKEDFIISVNSLLEVFNNEFDKIKFSNDNLKLKISLNNFHDLIKTGTSIYRDNQEADEILDIIEFIMQINSKYKILILKGLDYLSVSKRIELIEYLLKKDIIAFIFTSDPIILKCFSKEYIYCYNYNFIELKDIINNFSDINYDNYLRNNNLLVCFSEELELIKSNNIELLFEILIICLTANDYNNIIDFYKKTNLYPQEIVDAVNNLFKIIL